MNHRVLYISNSNLIIRLLRGEVMFWKVFSLCLLTDSTLTLCGDFVCRQVSSSAEIRVSFNNSLQMQHRSDTLRFEARSGGRVDEISDLFCFSDHRIPETVNHNTIFRSYSKGQADLFDDLYTCTHLYTLKYTYMHFNNL